MSIFRSAIQGDDGSVDAGYLALFWTMAVTVGSIPFVVLGGAFAIYLSPKDAAAIIQATGVAVGAICVGGAGVIGAVGVFRVGDKPRIGAPAVTTTMTTTTAPVPEVPVKVDVVAMPKAKKR